MSCPDCGCTETTVNCNCPEPTGIEAARIENIVSAELGGGQNISGAGYTHTLYTNSSTGNQIVYAQTNMLITCPLVHDITTQYLKNAAPVGTAMEEDNAVVKTDFTHFITAITLAPGDILKINVQSSDANGTLNMLTSFIYKYDV